MHCRRVDDVGKWYAQHGDNPEHRTPEYNNAVLLYSLTREWRERIHERR